MKAAVKDAEVVFLAVGTPSKPDGTVDMSFLESAGKEVCDALAANYPGGLLPLLASRSWPTARGASGG